MGRGKRKPQLEAKGFKCPDFASWQNGRTLAFAKAAALEPRVQVAELAFIAALVLLVALSGCLDALSSEERALCLDRTSYARTSVPACKTQEECFAGVESSLKLQDSLFSADARTSLNLYKNYLALSWVHYNEALENTREIHNICYSAKDFSLLVPQVNDLSRNLLNAFAAADAANREAFTLLLILKQDLETDDINMLREEPLFNDYANISTNLNIISLAEPSDAVLNSNSYAGFYLSRIGFFSELSQELGFAPPKAQRYSPIDLLARYDSQLLKAKPSQVFYMRFAIDAILGLVDYLNSMLTLNRASEALQRIPTFELLNAYNDLAGTGNSAPGKFAELTNSTHSNKAKLIQGAEQLRQGVLQNLSALDSAISLIDSSAYASFDHNFLSELHSLLGQNSEISVQRYPFEEISSFRQSALSEALALRRSFEALVEDDALARITLGRKASALKELLAKSSGLLDEVNYVSTEVASGLEVLCETRVSFIEDEIAKLESGDVAKTAASVEAADLSARLLYRIGNFKQSESQKEKLLFCRPIIEDFAMLKQALNDLSAYESAAGSRISECLSYLGISFEKTGDSLQELSESYAELLETPIPYTNPASVIAKCESLRAELDSALAQKPDFAGIYSNHAVSEGLISALKELALRSPESISASELQRLVKKFSGEDALFKNGILDAAVALSSPVEISESSSALASELSEALQAALSDYLARTAKLELFPQGIAVLGKPMSVQGRITIDNAIADYNSTIAITVPFPAAKGLKPVYATPNLSGWELQNSGMRLVFSKMPLGMSVAEFSFVAEAPTAGQSTKIIAIDPFRALLMQSLILKTPGRISRLLVNAQLPGAELGAEKVLVYFRGTETSSSFSANAQGVVEFYLNDVENSDSVEIYYSLGNPIAYSATLASSSETDENLFVYNYELAVENRLPIEINSARITLPVPVWQGSLLKAELYSSSGAKIPVSVLPNNSVSFMMSPLVPRQAEKFMLSLSIADQKNYWSGVLSQLQIELQALSNSAYGRISADASKLLASLEALKQDFDYSDKSHLAEVQRLVESGSALASKEQMLAGQKSEFEKLSQDILQKLSEAQANAEKLASEGFSTYASSSKLAIQEAEREVDAAEKFRLSSDYNAGILRLAEARSILAEIPSAGFGLLVESGRKERMESANKLFSETSQFSLQDLNLVALKDSILSADSGVSGAISQQDFLRANSRLGNLDALVGDYNNALALALKNSAESMLQRIDYFETLVADSLDLASQAGTATGAVKEDDLTGMGYAVPITAERLAEIKENTRVLEEPLQNEISKFKEAVQNENYRGALLQSKEFLPRLERAVSQAEKAKGELSSALSSLKEDAASALSKARTKAKFAEYNAEAEQLLDEASAAVGNKRYLQTILLSNRATALMGFAQASGFELPLAVLPFIGIIAAALFLRWRSKKAAAMRQAIKIPRVGQESEKPADGGISGGRK